MLIRIRNSLATLFLTTCSGCALVWPVAPETEELEDYIESHMQALGERFITPLSRDAFTTRLRDARILYLGDHHRDTEHHVRLLELIEWVCDQGYQPVLGIEAIGTEDNPHLQEYLNDDISLELLRTRVLVRWQDSWLDSASVDSKFFRSLLRLAHDRGLSAFPLEPTPRLALGARDSVIAKQVRRALVLHPDELLIVVVGHAHLLGNGHLVGRVGTPSIVIGAELSETLEQEFQNHPATADTEFLRTDRNVLFLKSGFGGVEQSVRR